MASRKPALNLANSSAAGIRVWGLQISARIAENARPAGGFTTPARGRRLCIAARSEARVATVEELVDPKVSAAVDAYFAALSTRDEARWIDQFAGSGVCHQPVGTIPAEGERELREVRQMLTGPFETLHVAQESAFYCGTGAAVKWRARGHGINGREISFEGISVFEIDADGKIQTVMAYWDPAAMLIDLAGAANA
jgi:steroid delta-isomerase